MLTWRRIVASIGRIYPTDFYNGPSFSHQQFQNKKAQVSRCLTVRVVCKRKSSFRRRLLSTMGVSGDEEHDEKRQVRLCATWVAVGQS